ncbi:MAG: hypothetical protein JOZ62_16230 [Acidobacteriaceae bacterium]|nr:hypothetical protein [Acidobacteriaceae bacterium]
MMPRSKRAGWVRYRLFLPAMAALSLIRPVSALAGESERIRPRQDQTWCTCPEGGTIQAGAMRYDENSDREMITRIEVERNGSEARCAAVWVGFTEMHPKGTPFSFYLSRRHLREQREDGCGDSPSRFKTRSKVYRFIFDSDSTSIREMDTLAAAPDTSHDGHAASKSNANLWDSISIDDPVESEPEKKRAVANPSSPEFCRTAWVVARKDTRGHYVAITRGPDQHDNIIALHKAHRIKAGQVGQIEASNGHTAIVRFYDGSRVERFAKTKNALRRWYDDTGGPYTEAKDDLYTPLRACILEVSLDDIVEVNDYLDEARTDRT